MQSEEEKRQILEEFESILDSNPRCQTPEKRELVTKAFNFANRLHSNMRRKSGEPYIYHPLAVARIVSDEIGLGATSICAALLHDVVEDTDTTIEEIENLFGKIIANIVDGLTKMKDIFDHNDSIQAENFKKMLFTLSDDVRVILIKLADRLHNMRTLEFMLPRKQMKITGETLFMFAPLAHRLGLHAIKTELEDLAFQYKHPKKYQKLKDKIESYLSEYEDLINQFALPIDYALKEKGFDVEILWRPKSVYSTWEKMQRKKVNFSDIYDLLAMRLIVTPKGELDEKIQCMQVYSIITGIYRPHPKRFRDWLSTPKANGYEALHTTVMSKTGKWIEVQIRTTRMNEIAEKGVAAHWKYKEKEQQEKELDHWLRKIRESLHDKNVNALEFLDEFKLNLFASEIQVFSPKGDTYTLPTNSTALDFAYAIHTEVGNKCIAAKINSKLKPLNQPLRSGDQVEIIISDKNKPKFEWLEFITTATAKSKVTSSLKNNYKSELKKGQKILDREIKGRKLKMENNLMGRILTFYGLTNNLSLYYKIANGDIDISKLDEVTGTKKRKLINYWSFSSNRNKDSLMINDSMEVEKHNKKLPDTKKVTDYTIATCCNPIPGDDVVGYIQDDKAIEIHKRRCVVAEKLMTSFGENIITLKWAQHKKMSYLTKIQLQGIDSVGTVNKVTNVISRNLNVNMRFIKFESEDGLFNGEIELYIQSIQALNGLFAKLLKISEIKEINRVED